MKPNANLIEKRKRGFFYGKVLYSQISSMHYLFKMYAAQVYLYAK